jgi:poly(hydroxyalkanoate) granule-associated protein
MKRTQRPRRARGASTADASQGLRDSAQKIWLAGLGALERARTEGPRMFESLVEQGRDMGARAVGMADEALRTVRQGKLAAVTSKDVEKLIQQVQGLGEPMRRFMAGVAGAATQGARRAPSPAAGRRSKAKAAAGKKKRAATGTRKPAARKARKASRAARPRG